MCLDAREINKYIHNDHDQPPTIEEVFQRIGRRKIFSSLDISSAFWQIPLTESSKKYTGFLFDGQTYVFNRLPFGLKTAGAVFTRAINAALKDKTNDFAIIYLDDILIASDSWEEHLEHLRIVFKCLEEVGFKLKLSKCQFMKKEIKFLGHTFTQVKAKINDETRLAVEKSHTPKNKKQLQAFLGLINWDRRFIPNLAELTKPLEKLLKKDAKFIWDVPQMKAFLEIKERFKNATELFIIRKNYPFGIYTDASNNGLGARLYQFNENTGEQFTIAYASRSLKGAEANYHITELECLAIVWALQKWYVYLAGNKVQVNTDHKALQYLETCVMHNNRIARWWCFLQQFDLQISHIEGKRNIQADYLSRNNDKINQGDNRINLINNPQDGAETTDWVTIIKRAQQKDKQMQNDMKNYPSRVYKHDDLIRYHDIDSDKVILPDSVSWEIINRAHKFLLHFGSDKTLDFIKQHFHGLNLDKIVKDVVASCNICQATKYCTRPTVGEQYFEIPEKPGQLAAVDIFGPLPCTKGGFKYIFVIMDTFSKFIKLYPIKNQKLESIIDCMQKYFNDIGKPLIILSDNGGQFITQKWELFARKNNCQIRHTSPYNPQANPVERVMREIGRIIRTYASKKQTKWDKIIPRSEEIINGTRHSATDCTPNSLQFKNSYNLEIDYRLLPTEKVITKWKDRIQIAKRKLQAAAQKRKTQFLKHGFTGPYEVGQMVWTRLHRRSDASRRLTRKIHLVYDMIVYHLVYDHLK